MLRLGDEVVVGSSFHNLGAFTKAAPIILAAAVSFVSLSFRPRVELMESILGNRQNSEFLLEFIDILQFR